LYVARFGPDVPIWDDYAVIPQLCGTQPVTMSWLWSQHSEHRIPLARLILLSTFRLTGADPRPVMFLMVGLLAALAALLIVTARSNRGGYQYADAFLPIVLLNLGQHENLLWGIQTTYVLPVFLLGVVLVLAIRSRRGEPRQGRGRPGLASLAMASVCITLLPLCNAGGLAMVPALLLWFWSIAVGAMITEAPAARSRVAWTILLSLPPFILMLFYFRGYSAPKHHAAPGGLGTALQATVQFLGMGLGEPGKSLWPWSGLLVVALLAGSMLVLLRSWILDPVERFRIEGLACVLLAVVSLALASGWGRSGEDVRAGLQPRYTTLALPALLGAYFAFTRYGSGVTRRLLPMILLAGWLVLLWPNTHEAWEAGRGTLAQCSGFDRDLAAGTPLFRLVRRYSPFLHPSQESLHEALGLLQGAAVGKFRTLRLDPEFQEVPVTLTPNEVRLGRWNRGQLEVTGPDPWIRFDLPGPMPVCGIRLRYSHSSPGGAPARFRMAWRRPGQREFPLEQQYGNWNLPTGDDQTTTVWVDDVVSQIRIQPDNRPCRFTIAGLSLLASRQDEIKRP
jgi:hypothetical protein